MRVSPKSIEDIVNLKIIKKIWLYHLFDSSCRKIFNFNVYRMILMLIACTYYVCIIFFGSLGYFSETDNTIDIISELLMVFAYMINILSLIKLTLFCIRQIIFGNYSTLHALHFWPVEFVVKTSIFVKNIANYQ